MKTEVVKERTYYAPVFFKDRDGRCSLLTRHFEWRQGKKLRLYASGYSTVEFANEEALGVSMLALEGDWAELPAEADGNPRYVPEEFRL